MHPGRTTYLLRPHASNLSTLIGKIITMLYHVYFEVFSTLSQLVANCGLHTPLAAEPRPCESSLQQKILNQLLQIRALTLVFSEIAEISEDTMKVSYEEHRG